MLITKRLNFLDLDFDAGRQLASVSSQNGGCQRRQRRQMGGNSHVPVFTAPGVANAR